MIEENAKYCENFRKNLLVIRENTNQNEKASKKTRSLSRNPRKSPQGSQESIKKRKTSVSCEIPAKINNKNEKNIKNDKNPKNDKKIVVKKDKEIHKETTMGKKKQSFGKKESKIEETFRRFLLKSIKK